LLGCKLLEKTFAGNPGKADGYYQGFRDDMINKNSYLYSLATLGTVVQSAYLTLKTGNVDAYNLVNDKWVQHLKDIYDNIETYDLRTQTEWLSLAKLNEKRITKYQFG